MASNYVYFFNNDCEFSAKIVTYCEGILFISLHAMNYSPKEVISTIFTDVKNNWLSREEEAALGGNVKAVVCSLNGIPVLISSDADNSDEIYANWERGF